MYMINVRYRNRLIYIKTVSTKDLKIGQILFVSDVRRKGKNQFLVSDFHKQV